MAIKKRATPDFFAESTLDPVESATGYSSRRDRNSDAKSSAYAHRKQVTQAVVKKKAGFYLSTDILNRFTLKFYELKLAGVAIGNKSTLLERLLCFALNDLDKGKQSSVLKKLSNG